MKQDILSPDTSMLSRYHSDSLRIQELMMQVQEMKMNEIVLANEKENKNKTDSLKKADQIRQIDSLRKITAGFPVVIDRDTLFSFYARRGGVMPADRAEKTKDMIYSLGKKLILKPDTLHVFNSEYVTDIMSGDKVILSLTDQDAMWQNTTRQELAGSYLQIVSKKISDLHAEYGLQQKIKSILLLVLIILLQIGLIYLTNKLFKRIRVLTPAPFVLVRELCDFYISYQINAYTDRDLSMPKVYSDLYKNIIDRFNEAGIEIMSPHFYSTHKGKDVVIPPEYIKTQKDN